MCRPLKDIVSELEEKYEGCELEYTLEERVLVILDYQNKMEYLLMLMNQYEYDVSHTLEYNLSLAIISRITQNLLFFITNAYESLLSYTTAVVGYMMDERYDDNYKYWKEFEGKRQEILGLIQMIQNSNIFEKNHPNADNCYDNQHIIHGFGDTIPPLVHFEKTLAYLNGENLLACLDYLMGFMSEKLNNLKNCGILPLDDHQEANYELNYLLYAKKYWPSKVLSFRSHIANQRLRNHVSINELERLRNEAIHEFEYHTDFGKIWRDYSEDKTTLFYKMKDMIKKPDEWKTFFSEIFEIEEYARWIEELRNPPESDEDKQKRERLLNTNKVINLQPAKSKKGVDVLLLYQFIDSRFVTEKMFVYEWYALYTLLRRMGILMNCTTEDFASQMKDEEWFGHVTKKCSANDINTYHFLDSIAPDVWIEQDIPGGSNATKKALNNIYRKYSDLEDYIDEIFVED